MIVVIVNPAAGRGSGGRILGDVESAFSDRAASRVVTTKASGDESRLTAEALREGARTIVVVGGDGTSSHVAGEILSARSDCSLALIPCGTGNDLAKTLGVERATPAEIAGLIARGNTTRIDVGRVDGHHFINSCGFGFDASVLEASNRIRFIRGHAVYIYSALSQLFTYRGTDVSANGAPGVKAGRKLMITVSNGRFLGGAFKIAPHASVLDGKLDVCFFNDSNVVERVRLFVGAIRGTHIGMRSVSTASVDRIALTFPSSPSMEVDGELRVARSKTVELQCLPGALSVIAAPGAIV